jgi:hypothetical protein
MGGAFLSRMEDVWDVYSQPVVTHQPVVVTHQSAASGEEPLNEPSATVRLCFEERPCQLPDEGVAPLGRQPNKPSGRIMSMSATACVLLAYDLDTPRPYVQLREQRNVQRREQRTQKEYAQFTAHTT